MKTGGGARSVALEALLEIEHSAAFADEVLDRRLSRAGLDARDRALTFELVYGVLRHKATLDWRLVHVADRPIERLPRVVATALRLAAYQLLFLERIPPSAAVNESVALAKSIRPTARIPAKDWSGFVNAVLRSLIREPAPPWPDPDLDPVAALAIRHSCPSWLAARWLTRLGADRAEALCRATLAIPPLTIRTNRLRITREALAASLSRTGHIVTPTQVSPVGLVLEKCGPVADLPQFQDGLLYVEDEAGQLVAPLLDPQPGERILDACAAPGGKTTHLAALMQNRGEIVAMDRQPIRLRRLEENCRRMGITNVRTVASDATGDAIRIEKDLFSRPFDRILLDAPCSGLGVLRRHPEGKWHKDERSLTAHQTLQRTLLERVSGLLRPGGVFVYSTCSTEPDENEDVIEHFCKQHAEFRREPVAPWLPDSGRDLLTAQGNFSTLLNSHSMDVFFAARLRKADR
ncbi:MAG: 16S rRNA (cytosine(967)-C(5))-methyltransferase RsmB [Nitrospirae bacterium]|nr:MAG: 16S rRNA (cytosine(967)-C(5))-methyltransferase RsmB [Nitrospirota bacterium]